MVRKYTNVSFALKVIVYSFLLPGTVVGVVPFFIFWQSGHPIIPKLSILTLFACFLLAIGVVFLVRCIYDFALHGEGTLLPIDPPKVIVVRGYYKYTRNPMYLAVLCILLSEAMLFNSFSLLLYFLASILIVHFFVLLYEEPHLRKQFGKEYENYCRVVPRWWIARQPYTGKIRKT